jgi:hypothetical protein
VGPRQPRHSFGEDAAHALAIAIEEESDEEGNQDLDHALADGRPHCEQHGLRRIGQSLGQGDQLLAALHHHDPVIVKPSPEERQVADEFRQLDRLPGHQESAQGLDQAGGVHDEALRGEGHRQDQEDDEPEHQGQRRERAAAVPAVAQPGERRPRREAEHAGEEYRADERPHDQDASQHQQGDGGNPGVLLDPTGFHKGWRHGREPGF